MLMLMLMFNIHAASVGPFIRSECISIFSLGEKGKWMHFVDEKAFNTIFITVVCAV